MTENQKIFKMFEEYNFESDDNFQTGLPTIVELNKDKPKKEVDSIIEKAKWFYFCK
nr:12942_t:CDS:2 [Entrophospora candida]